MNVWETKQCLLVWVTTQFSLCKLYSLVQHHLQACSQGCLRGLTKIYLLVSCDYYTCKACSCKPLQECAVHGGRKQCHCSERCYESSWKWWLTFSALSTVSWLQHTLCTKTFHSSRWVWTPPPPNTRLGMGLVSGEDGHEIEVKQGHVCMYLVQTHSTSIAHTLTHISLNLNDALQHRPLQLSSLTLNGHQMYIPSKLSKD